MEKEKLLDYVAPCSLLCYACMSCKDAPFQQGAKSVYKYSDGLGEYWSMYMPRKKRKKWNEKFDAFRGKLLEQASCPGCRNMPSSGREGCVCPESCVNCAIPACAKEHGVDFCAQCDAFPCDKLEPHCVDGNRRIKEIGVEAYFEEKKDVSHFIDYKKTD